MSQMRQMRQMSISLDQLTGTNRRAADILLGNDRGGYTVPSAKLYPFQWNWDSALVALGFSVFDSDRAWQEVESLLSAQWDNGMVPHIIFWKEEKATSPDRNNGARPTSPKTRQHRASPSHPLPQP